jgi:hypothetical protein
MEDFVHLLTLIVYRLLVHHHPLPGNKHGRCLFLLCNLYVALPDLLLPHSFHQKRSAVRSELERTVAEKRFPFG